MAIPEPSLRIVTFPELGQTQIDTDVVVVGSGAGGAAVAAELAEGGLKVLVLEEGPYFTTQDFRTDVTNVITRTMRDAGTTITIGRSPVQYLEGRCVGGTTVINGGMCWRTPDKVLKRWGMEHGLTRLTSKSLQPLFERVEQRISAREQDVGTEGKNSLVFQRGCEKLGYKTVRNIRNQVHCVGSNDCVTGCPTGAKQSTAHTYLTILCRYGGSIVTSAKVEKIRVEGGKATGVVARIQNLETGQWDKTLAVSAKIVVLSCGATQTPLLLLRNRIGNRSRQVGRNFTIHPNIKISAMFDEPIDTMRGAHQAFQCREFQDEGILIAPGGVSPPLMSVATDLFGAEHGDFMLKQRYLATGGVLVDDFAAGRVSLGPFGIPLVRYDITNADQHKFIRGAALAAEIYLAAGAREVYTAFGGVGPIRNGDDIRRLFLYPPKIEHTEYFTAHLMGTCRMDRDPTRGVVDESGQSHDIRNLFVADASILPTPIGVNPQETIMALATHIAGDVLNNWKTYRQVAA
ncbi:MAG: GMC family oxidoreductase [Myxococcales bacterium]|nr:GMC family oxidoreductase [Myxococcales bacterium]